VHVASPATVEQAIHVLGEIARFKSPVPTVVLSEHDDVEMKVNLLRLGAVDCLLRPLDLSRLALLVDLLTVRARYGPSADIRDDPRGEAEEPGGTEGFLFADAAMRRLREQLERVAPLETTILLTGETGTGKTHLARVIHEFSPRRQKPFRVVHCGALPPTLIESEMFGHTRGAFTHADRNRAGKFAEAQDGTLLLDEIDCVPLEMQARLLQVVEERVFEPIGSDEVLRFRARLVVASNRRLEEEVAAERFRSDLYYRLKAVDFEIPPLRDRREMIEPLADKFVADFSSRYKRPVHGISTPALGALESYHWPGNVRELRNAMDRAVALCPQPVIGLDDLPDPIRQYHEDQEPAGPGSIEHEGNQLARARETAEMRKVLDALRRNHNNRSRAASELGISRVTLYKKMRKYGLS
jgi:DNA-binding NtrC family response regulator